MFHGNFGDGEIIEIEGNKQEIQFEQAGRKRALDSFVSIDGLAALPLLDPIGGRSVVVALERNFA